MNYVLGVNAFHGDSSAAILRDGLLVGALEEERLNRIKHWAGFPAGAIEAVCEEAGVSIGDVGHVAVSRDPAAHLVAKMSHALRSLPRLSAIADRLSNYRSIGNLSDLIRDRVKGGRFFSGKVHRVEHHRSHLASAFFCSPFETAACLTVDGFGDFVSSMSGAGRGNKIQIKDEIIFPESLGILYTACTQYLGFPRYGDEYKVMGLAAYGDPAFLPQMRKIARCQDQGRYSCAPDYFQHTAEGITMSWDAGEPVVGRLWSGRWEELLGPAREPGAELTDRHRNVAASLQALYEEVFFHRLRWLQKQTREKALCLAGGCALNSVANGKIFDQTPFCDVFVQSAAGDAGTALGAALYLWHQEMEYPRRFIMEHSYWGPAFDDESIVAALAAALGPIDIPRDASEAVTPDFSLKRTPDERTLCRETASAIAKGEIVGWFQGRSEWGPRALGNRSIVVDPRRPDMKDVLNSRIKRREPFRPFAPSILEEYVGDYFERDYPDPFMIKVYPVRPEKRREIPAVTHVDGTGRLQTVSRQQNERYWNLINEFRQLTGVPVVLNTSFNENEPIVNTPTEAINCFLRTRMDRLVLGNWVLLRRAA